MTRRVLVTGASGFVGGHLARMLGEDGCEVRAAFRTPGRLGHLDGVPGIEPVMVDLAGGGDLQALVEDVEEIYHCAAFVRPWGRREHYERANVHATRDLVTACAAAGNRLSRFVHLSTVDVYGYPAEPADEDTPVRLDRFEYGRSKALGEREVHRLAGHEVAFTIVRPANVYGPRGQFVTEIAHALRRGLMLEVDGGRCHAGLTYVDNLAANIVRAARSDRAAGGTYNLRDDYDVDWHEYLARLADGIGAPRCRLDLRYPVAMALASAVEAPNRLLGLGAEPLLHRMLVEMFGRTCGHPIERAERDFAARTDVGFCEAMRRSIEWYTRRAG